MTEHYDTTIFIGRFQPLHNAHLSIILHALKISKKIIIFVGSSYKPRSYKNPFYETERIQMITNTLVQLGYTQGKHFNIIASVDYLYDNLKWANEIKGHVKLLTNQSDKIAIIGHKKDNSSFYLDIFPEYDLVEVPLLENLNSQDIRKLYFRESHNLNFLSGVIPIQISSFLQNFSKTDDFEMLIKERKYEETYKKLFSDLPYPPTFITSDAVVFSENHVLLIERDREPGKGLLALPGGFLDAENDVSIESAMFRELKEETSLQLNSDHIIGSCVFDAIGRSSRGRVITHAFVLRVNNLPKVSAHSDAKSVDWYPIKTLNRRNFFEDHFDIITICGGI